VKIKKITYKEPTNEALPILLDYTSLAYALDLDGSGINGLVKGATRVKAGEANSLYEHFQIPKSGGGVRHIYSPKRVLSAVQAKVRERILSAIPKMKESAAYEPGSRPGDTAALIAGAEVIVKLDIKNYFPSILQSTVRKFFEHLGYPEEVANLLGGVLCVLDKDGKRFVPQGGPASPMLANRVAEWLIDPEVKKVTPKGWCYRRYCDNLYLWPSSPEALEGVVPKDLLTNLKKAVWAAGFSGHQGKIVPKHKSQRILGLCVNVKANMPREKYKALKACLHNCATQGLESQMDKAILLGFKRRSGNTIKEDKLRFIRFLSGYLSYYKHFLVANRIQRLEKSFHDALAREGNAA
tara:strand:+ start:1452 stop:2510 length:1059 start_codon:yes stop_codon:yes gene_type:complete